MDNESVSTDKCRSTHQTEQHAVASGGAFIQQSAQDIVNISVPYGPSGLSFTSITPPWRKLDEVTIRGRDNLIAELTDASLLSSGQLIVLHGGGGYGKTTLAIAIARILQKRGRVVFWISARDELSISAGMREVALQLRAAPHTVIQAWSGYASAPELVWRMLAQVEHEWLLVFDNADEPAFLLGSTDCLAEGSGWLRWPQNNRGAVLVTTRWGSRRFWGASSHLRRVSTLDSESGADVLLDWAGERAGSRREAEKLAQHLGGLPLALRMAGSYLSIIANAPPLPGLNRHAGFSDYRESLTQSFSENVDLASKVTPAQVGDHELITRTWEISLDSLERKGLASARPLMRLLSCLASESIPYQLLDSRVLSGSALFTSLQPDELLRLLQSLIDFGMIDEVRGDPRGDEACLVLHPLIRETNRHHPDVQKDWVSYAKVISELVYGAVRNLNPDEPASIANWRLLAPHCSVAAQIWLGDIRSARSEARYSHQAAYASAKAGHFLYRVGQYPPAKRALALASDLQREISGPESPDVLSARYNIGRVLRAEGAHEEAEAEFANVLEIQKSILGPHHADTLATRNQLAFVAMLRGRVQEAEGEFRDVAALQEKLLGPTHPNTLLACHNLGQSLLELGRLREAESVLKRVASLRTQTLGEDHAHTLFSRFVLAQVFAGIGNLDSAEQQLIETLAIQSYTLGQEHPDALASRRQLGITYTMQGKLSEARRELREVLTIQRRTLGAQNADTQRTQALLRRIQDG